MKQIRRYTTLSRRVIVGSKIMYVLVGNYVSAGLAALFWFVLANQLLPDEYGRISYVISIATFGNVIALFGLNITIMTFLSKDDNLDLFKEACLFTFLLGLICSLILIFVGQLTASILLMAEVSYGMYLSKTLGEKKYKRYGALIVLARSMQITAGLFLFRKLGTSGLIIGYILPLFILGTPYFKYLRINFHFDHIRARLRFTVHNFITSLTDGIQNFLDKLIVGFLFGFSTLAIYHLTFQFFWIMAILPGSLFQYLLPERSTGNPRYEIEIVGLLLAIVIALGGFFTFPIVIKWLFPKFQDSIVLIQIVCFAVIPATLASIRRASLLAQGRSYIPLKSNILASMVHIGGLIVFRTLLGDPGLAFTVVLSQCVLLISLILLSRIYAPE